MLKKFAFLQNVDWSWYKLRIEGQDIVCDSTICTWFGGNDDEQDNGQTSSGVVTEDNPTVQGCAIPSGGYKSSVVRNSPLPKIPFKTNISVTNLATGKTITVPFIDLGPDPATKHGIDLTQQSFKDLGGDKTKGTLNVAFRIPNGASLYVKPYVPKMWHY